MKLKTLRQSLLQRVRTQENAVPARDVDSMLEYALGLSRVQILSYPELDVRKDRLTTVEQLFERLLGGEPLAYITAHQEFFGYDFIVTPSVLIPRPETERLVERALEVFSDVASDGRFSRVVVYDVGTGSGAIILSMVSELKRRFSFAKLREHSFTGVDISQAALAIASFNCGRLGHEELLGFRQGDLLSTLEDDLRGVACDQSFFLMLSNPPYIPDAERLDTSVEDYEPALALRGGPGGTELPERLLEEFRQKSAGFYGGTALIEIGHQQSHTVECVARRLGFDGVEFIEDFHGIRRIALIER